MRVSMSRAARRLAPLTLLALGAVAACSDGTASGSGKMSVLLTDAPGDVKSAVVTISEIDLQGSNGGVVLMNTPVTTDLLTLANSTAQLVNDAVVPAGTYTQLRFVITGAYLEVENGSGGTSIYASSPTYEGLPAGAQVAGTLQMPSYGESGLKVNLPGGAIALTNAQRVVLVDFDVSRSFGQQAGASGQWTMHPVLTATDFQASGSVTVTLARDPSVTMPTINGSPLGLGDFSAVLSDGNGGTKTLQLTDTDGDGVYEAGFLYVAPGNYTVDLGAPSGVTFATAPARPASVSIASGQTATSAFTLTSAATAP
jgi:hypothetical protein